MIFSNIILLFFVEQIRQFNGVVDTAAVDAESLMILSVGPIMKTENLISSFLTDLKKFSFDKLCYYHLDILGKNKILLDTTKSLLKSQPYSIGSEVKANYPIQFGFDIVVLFFIDGFTDSEVNRKFDKLPNIYSCKVAMISIKENITDESEVQKMINLAEKNGLKNVVYAQFNGQVIKIYRELFKPSCRTNLTLINTWTPYGGFRKKENIFPPPQVTINGFGCPIFISTVELEPMLMFRKDEEMKGGVERRLVQTVAKHFNFIAVFRVSTTHEKFISASNGTVFGIVAEVARNESSVGIGQIMPTPARAKRVDFTSSYNHECIVWTVPFWPRQNFNLVTSEFSRGTWIMLIIVVLLCCGLVYLIPNLGTGNPAHREWSFNIFDLIAMSLSYAVPRSPTHVVSRLCFLLYLHNARVISTAYSASLSSIMTAATPEPSIVDENGIIASGLRTAGTRTIRTMLASQTSSDSTRAALVDRFEVITRVSEALTRITERQDVAYLRHQSTMNYVAGQLSRAGKPINFHSLDDCVTSYHSVMVTPKGSPLTSKFNPILTQLREAGIYKHWIGLDYGDEIRINQLQNDDHTLPGLRSIFVLYLWCLVPAFLAFSVELIVFYTR